MFTILFNSQVRTTAIRCELVKKSWKLSAQRVLYSTITLKEEGQFRKLASAWNNNKEDSPGSLTRTLNYEIYGVSVGILHEMCFADMFPSLHCFNCVYLEYPITKHLLKQKQIINGRKYNIFHIPHLLIPVV
jgi:hypothetical protein